MKNLALKFSSPEHNEAQGFHFALPIGKIKLARKAFSKPIEWLQGCILSLLTQPSTRPKAIAKRTGNPEQRLRIVIIGS